MKKPWLFQLNEVLSWITIHNKTKRVLKNIHTCARATKFTARKLYVDFNFIFTLELESAMRSPLPYRPPKHARHLTNDSLHHMKTTMETQRGGVHFKYNTHLNCWLVLFNLLFQQQQLQQRYYFIVGAAANFNLKFKPSRIFRVQVSYLNDNKCI